MIQIGALLIVVAFAMAVSTVIAVLLERIAYRPLRRAPRLIPLITAIGASFFLEYAFRGLFGSGIKSYPEIDILEGNWDIFGISLDTQKIRVVVIVAAILMLIGL